MTTEINGQVHRPPRDALMQPKRSIRWSFARCSGTTPGEPRRSGRFETADLKVSVLDGVCREFG